MSPDAYGNLAARLRAAARTASPELQADLILAADEIGGMMYSQGVASRAIDEAVAAEREACAKIAARSSLLIAAAPDLYEALSAIIDLPDGIDANYIGERDALAVAMQKAKAALAKARGEKQT